jgi:hypothetical protein
MHRITLPLITLAFITAVSTAAAAAAPYHGASHGYNITLPDDWTQIPADVVDSMTKLAQNPNAKTALITDAAFQPKVQKRWFSYPYMIVQIIPYSGLGLNRQINEDEFADLTKAMTGIDVSKTIDSNLSKEAKSILSNASIGQPQLDRGKRRFLVPMNMTVAGIGKVKGTLAGYFGHRALVQVGVYATEADADRIAPTSQQIIDSFHFDPADDYSVAAALANPTPANRTIWSGVFEKALMGGIAGAIIGGIVYAINRSKKSST